ncbi:MAG: succinate dehydrogenase [Candidatus Parabeggiatoa sp. nov. 2]|nr:MAG: succinate dehydrogenase [Beggiatoa sp. 4572_84]RKZ52146.1 MAG: succinate dehydrogenase [Gammaproteobacteria bacterium]
MNWLTKTLTSTVGQKVLMSMTGLFLISFLVVHLTGNLMLFKDDNGVAFNAYAHFMSTAGIIRVAELILVLGFVLHIYTAWRLTRHNRQTRPQDYIYSRPDINSSWFSRNMGITGSVVLIFLLTHLHHFWFKYKFQADIPLAAGTDYKDMYWLAQTFFQQEWWFSILYIVAMVFLGFHLAHAFESAFQTLGIHHKKYTPFLKKLGVLFAIIVPAGFATMPIYFLI